ncbi:unnamed protein product [Sphagnum jensenii]|uniref:Uncharacterized protein n=1 Tax=Sphagnum jensenii TaxID=128206 RepID=A0ABP0WBJ9_9BRYO
MEMEMEMGVSGRLLKCHTPRSRVESSCNCVDVNCVCSSPVSSRSEESWPGHKSYLPKMVRRELQKKYSQELQIRYTKLAHCHNASQILHQSHQTMAAREEARKQQRQELQMQYETVQKQKEIEIKSQQLCKLLKQQHELASIHNKKRLLLHFGWSPWLRLLLANR